MKTLGKLTLHNLEVICVEEQKAMRGGGYWYFEAGGSGWTYMADEIVINGCYTGGWYGMYLGPSDPNIDPSTLPPPINALDSACYYHDQGYYDMHAAGIRDALFNLDVTNYDTQLVVDAIAVVFSDDSDMQQRILAGGTAFVFSLISAFKLSALYFQQN